jgi:hypothetical protein
MSSEGLIFSPAVRNEMIVFTRSEGECFCVRAEVVSVRFSDTTEVPDSFAHKSALLLTSGLSAISFTYCGICDNENDLLSCELISFRMALRAAEIIFCGTEPVGDRDCFGYNLSPRIDLCFGIACLDSLLLCLDTSAKRFHFCQKLFYVLRRNFFLW